MQDQIVILSQDEIFSRVLELEFAWFQLHVRVVRSAEDAFSADLVLLDLDSMSAPTKGTYREMIGFTGSSALSADDAGRQCAMILHRPFEMNILRREVFGILQQIAAQASNENTAWINLPRTEHKRSAGLHFDDGVLFYEKTPIHLSQRETQIMQLLLSKRGQAVSREQILSLIGESSANKADVYICYLRKKLEEACSSRMIVTVRGKGYRLL